MASVGCESALCLDLGEGPHCAAACLRPTDCAATERCVPRLVEVLDEEGQAGQEQPRLICATVQGGERHLAERCVGHDACETGLCGPLGRCTLPCKADGCPTPLACVEGHLELAGQPLRHAFCAPRYAFRRDLLTAAATISATGLTEPLRFALPEGAASVLLAVEDKDELRVAIERLEGPDGTLLVSYDASEQAVCRAFDELGMASINLPDSDRPEAKLQSGEYKLWLRTYEARFDERVPTEGSVDVASLRWRPLGQRGGLVDLDLYLAPETGFVAATAGSDAKLQDALTELGRLLETLAGVGLGEVRYVDLPTGKDVVADADATRALRRDHVADAGPRGRSIPLLLVKDISYGFKGLAGGIPGIPGLVGRPTSGIVVALQSQPARLGRLFAHELGHYLGLWHTTEPGAVGYDRLLDTPECVSGTKVSDCPDKQNLMFPFYLDQPAPLSLSAAQVEILRKSPFVYEERFPLACGGEKGPDVAGVSRSGFGSGSTAGLADRAQGSCGGSGGERVHLYRLEADAQSLNVEVVADAAAVVYVRRGECAESSAEVACEVGEAGKATSVTVEGPKAGAYYVFVDSAGASGGDYRLRVSVTP